MELDLFNANFNNISVISWRSVLLVVEIGIPGENHQPVAHWIYTYLFNQCLSQCCEFQTRSC
jgi:hypothetical protein